MRKTTKSPGEKVVKDFKRATRQQYSSEEQIRIVLDGKRSFGVSNLFGGWHRQSASRAAGP
ncbi:hypothetical protein [uncultured Roseobacter sp.]|uniref:hypothetical protein n=1 Tax=uncultured Roseobacter sp. TaxID=114847 RepID=UPI00262B580E|nr:hypothetical protein [uncultured Roseobacter sp.]